MTQQEAKEHLRVSVEYIEARLIPIRSNPRPVKHKIRFTSLGDGGKRTMPRLLREDVYKILPLPETGTEPACDEEAEQQSDLPATPSSVRFISA
jgi:hypothetical protein